MSFNPIMGVTAGLKAGLKVGKYVMFGYDGIVDRKKRTPPRSITQSEDRVLQTNDRTKLTATIRDQRRNIALIQWMINKHLDYVSRFEFQPTTKDEGLNDNLRRLMKWWSRKQNCDIARRHTLFRFLRLLESHSVIDGDAAALKMGSGHLQGIEGDRIRYPTRGSVPESIALRKGRFVEGIEIGGNGQALNYLITRRLDTSFTYDKLVSARNVEHVGYFTRYDQVRGISPLASAINLAQDLYEGFDAQLIKTKMQAMFGLAIKHENIDDEATDSFGHTDRATGEAPTSETDDYDFELLPGLKLFLKPGDSVDTIESKSPSNEFQDFSKMIIGVAIKALDLPMTFYDSRESSFSAMRSDLNTYVDSTDAKRERLQEFLDNITAWKIGQWTNARTQGGDGPFVLDLPSGMLARDITWQWIPKGIMWIDPLKEVNAQGQAISLGLKSRQTIAAEQGLNWKDEVDQLEAEEKLLIEKGVTVQIGQPGAVTTREEELATESEDEDA